MDDGSRFGPPQEPQEDDGNNLGRGLRSVLVIYAVVAFLALGLWLMVSK